MNWVGGLITSSTRDSRRYSPAGTTWRCTGQPGAEVRPTHRTEDVRGSPGSSVRGSAPLADEQSLLDHSRSTPSALHTTISWRSGSRSRMHGRSEVLDRKSVV